MKLTLEISGPEYLCNLDPKVPGAKVYEGLGPTSYQAVMIAVAAARQAFTNSRERDKIALWALRTIEAVPTRHIDQTSGHEDLFIQALIIVRTL